MGLTFSAFDSVDELVEVDEMDSCRHETYQLSVHLVCELHSDYGPSA